MRAAPLNLWAVVLSWNGRDDTLACLASLDGVQAVCVDNGSVDGSPDAIAARFPHVDLVRAGVNLGFAAGCNVGIRRALDRGAEWVLLLNNDAVAEPGLVEALARAAAARPDAGILACKILAEDGRTLLYAGARLRLALGHSGRRTGFGLPDDGRWDALGDVERADGAGMAISRRALGHVGLLDERLFAYAEDVDLSLRVRGAGMAVVFVPDARVRHRGSASTGGGASVANLLYDTRNTIAVCERHRPLPRGLTGLRRGAIVGAHLAQAARHPHRRRAVAAVLRGWRDARRGRMGRARAV